MLLGSVCGNVVVAQYAYLIGAAKIQVARLDGSPAEDLLVDPDAHPEWVAVDALHGKLYWTESVLGRLKRANLDGTGLQTLVTADGAIRGVAIDGEQQMIYWAEFQPARIRRAQADGQQVKTIVQDGLDSPVGIALDVSAGKIYWTDWGTDKVQRANLDGSNVEDLVTVGFNISAAIAVDPVGGKIYWGQYSGDYWDIGLRRANLDGTDAETLIHLFIPTELSVDVEARKLYWTYDYAPDRKIQRSNLDGTNIEDFYLGDIGSLQGIDVDSIGGMVYWADPRDKVIRRSDTLGENVQVVIDNLMDYPQGLALDLEGGKMYWTDRLANAGTRLTRANLDGTGLEVIGPAPPDARIALDVDHGHVYMADGFYAHGAILRTNLDGTDSTEVLGFSDDQIANLALDVEGGKIYFTGETYENAQQIWRCNLDGSDVEVLLAMEYTLGACIGGIALDLIERKMYWIQGSGSEPADRIRRANLDGTDPEIVLSVEGCARDLILDVAAGKLYWVVRYAGEIFRANVDGTNIESWQVTDLSLISGIALDFRSLPGDCNRDGVVNLPDVSWFATCMTGPIGQVSTGCGCIDLDGNGHIDVVDFATVQNSLSECAECESITP